MLEFVSALVVTTAYKEKASARLAFLNWWAPRESNSAPTDYESAALTRHELEALGGVAALREVLDRDA